MAISSKQAANIFIRRAIQNGTPLTHMQVQKLVYFLHGWWHAVYEDKLIADKLQAWKYGPVYPELYNALKHHGEEKILEPIPDVKEKAISDEQNLIEDVYDVFGKYSGLELSNLTHQKNTPWFKTFMRSIRSKVDIPEKFMIEYFKEAYNDS